MSAARTLPNRIGLECAITDAEGDMLLLTLAIDDIDESVCSARPGDADGLLHPVILEKQLTALSHAHARVIESLRIYRRPSMGSRHEPPHLHTICRRACANRRP
ncbi:hypothetical protein [Lichenihabitans psoromatis]|uniref:hypothetical protein n=1 Tax=Lichenihabitans psoromatis TaxID=2528642 RepID=UPI00103626EF|nr:hypothetical protein [Lichenihabitans psoromatis]